MDMKAFYCSRVPIARVWKLAGKPVTPSQQLTSKQLERLAEFLTKLPSEPVHHVVFAPGCKRRINFAEGFKRGHPRRYWLELN